MTSRTVNGRGVGFFFLAIAVVFALETTVPYVSRWMNLRAGGLLSSAAWRVKDVFLGGVVPGQT